MLGPAVFIESCRQALKTRVKLFNDGAEIGHKLRELTKFPENMEAEETEVLVVGTGISSLSACRTLFKAGIKDVKIVELMPSFGGNSSSGKNEVSEFPWAAHYLPLPAIELTELQDFLKECNVITGIQNGLPIYNEEYLCADNEERLWINGSWQTDLLPALHYDEVYKEQWGKFEHLRLTYAGRKDNKGKYYFDIPVSLSSEEEEITRYHNISALDLLKQLGIDHESLIWYFNYCVSDDYGCNLQTCSAWALLHYFCARRGVAANAKQGAVLTWPQGNAFLASHLFSCFHYPISFNTICLKIEIKQNNLKEVICFDAVAGKYTKYLCRHLVLNTPHHVTRKLLPEFTNNDEVVFEHYPWIVANLTVSKMEERKGEALSWDNVLHKSNFLGYVVATHQLTSLNKEKQVFTFYQSLNKGGAYELRKDLRNISIEKIKEQVIHSLIEVYPEIEGHLHEVEIRKFGHGMIAPVQGLMSSPTFARYREPYRKIYFCHTDYCGISIFEEAFYKGIETARHIITNV